MRLRKAIVALTAVATAVGVIATASPASASSTQDDHAAATRTSTHAVRTVETARPSYDATPASTKCEQGPDQKAVEKALKQLGGFGPITVDGKLTDQECTTIKNFQKRYDIRPVHGYAGPLTNRIAGHLVNSSKDKCKSGKGHVVCIDLTHQTLWVTQNGKQIFAPTVVRTGMKGHTTTTGTWHINVREKKHWSHPFKVWLPYWQHFHDGMGLHETTTYIHDSFGSHGCINLLHADAKKLYEILKMNDTVYVFGHRSGT
ncbi:MAG TPA: L,D-transpeptidase [Stackebrandtia sp.]|jgi:hypothetical protein|uniref:L,D-transpeptidase family protein n=1 Tax=Stackebrandtia sp. TaxID=2023065 RepID=UPI002D392E25|nr:L,D-transpeptidase [Stackebrandtia sp.]HZE40944.1 L,D-transpeptidase [Stackebrandtia sp.]